MSKEKTLTITLEQAKEWYGKGGELKCLALQVFSEEELTETKLPKTWVECLLKYFRTHDTEYIDSTSEIVHYDKDPYIEIHEFTDNDKKLLPAGMSKPMLALCQLLICREVYRNGWKPDWKTNNDMHTIVYCDDHVFMGTTCNVQRVLTFQSEEVRDEFYENFKDLIEEAKELI